MAPLIFNHWIDEENWECICSFPINESLTDNELKDIVVRHMALETPNGKSKIVSIEPEWGGESNTGVKFRFYTVKLQAL
jgi:hypothetical protein